MRYGNLIVHDRKCSAILPGREGQAYEAALNATKDY